MINNVSHWFQDKHFSPYFNISEIGLLFTSDGVSSFNWQHFSFLVAYKIMVYLTIDSILNLMKCSNNDLVHMNRAGQRSIQIATGRARVGYHWETTLPVIHLFYYSSQDPDFFQMSYLSFYLLSVKYLLYHNQCFLLKELPTSNDSPVPHVKTRHLAWTSATTSAFCLIFHYIFLSVGSQDLWSNPVFPRV